MQFILLGKPPIARYLLLMTRRGEPKPNTQKITIIGTVAVIGMAKIQGHILSAKEVLNALCEAGYYIGDAIIETVLRDIGE